ITAGEHQTCALLTGGGLKCWGRNSQGQLGDGTTSHRSAPVDVSGLTSGVQMVRAAGHITCALTTTGGVKCWGENGLGGLGDGTTVDKNAPTDVVGLTSGVAAITVGDSHACALTNAGSVRCWGSNSDGQL